MISSISALPAKVVSGGKYLAACCPFCGRRGKSPDKKFHLYIKRNAWVYCFRCGYKNSYARFSEYFRIQVMRTATVPTVAVLRDNASFIDFDGSFISKGIINYLHGRGISDDMFNFFGLKMGQGNLFGTVVFIDGITEYWVARNIFNSHLPKTYNPRGKLRPLMYLLNGSNSSLYLVEGVFDMVPFVRRGLWVSACLGSALSKYQLDMLCFASPKSIYISLDADAMLKQIEMARQVANALPLSNIYIAEYSILGNYDPSSLGDKFFNSVKYVRYR